MRAYIKAETVRRQQLAPETVCLCLIADGERLANSRWTSDSCIMAALKPTWLCSFSITATNYVMSCHVMSNYIIPYQSLCHIRYHMLSLYALCLMSYCPWWGRNHYRFVIVAVYWLFHWVLLQTIIERLEDTSTSTLRIFLSLSLAHDSTLSFPIKSPCTNYLSARCSHMLTLFKATHHPPIIAYYKFCSPNVSASLATTPGATPFHVFTPS